MAQKAGKVLRRTTEGPRADLSKSNLFAGAKPEWVPGVVPAWVPGAVPAWVPQRVLESAQLVCIVGGSGSVKIWGFFIPP